MGMMANHVIILVCLIRGKMACCSVCRCYSKISCETNLYHATMFFQMICYIAFFVAVWWEG